MANKAQFNLSVLFWVPKLTGRQQQLNELQINKGNVPDLPVPNGTYILPLTSRTSGSYAADSVDFCRKIELGMCSVVFYFKLGPPDGMQFGGH